LIDIRELVTLAVAMPLFVLPYTMYFSGLAPLAAIPANILLAIVTPLITILAGSLVAVSFAAPIASLLGLLTSVIVNATVSFLHLCSHLPLWNTPTLSGWRVAAIYAVVSLVLMKDELRLTLWRLRNSPGQRTS
jgi:hypothetical protein